MQLNISISWNEASGAGEQGMISSEKLWKGRESGSSALANGLIDSDA